MKSIIIIPAYNPPLSFTKLLNQIRKHTSTDILIINDGSTKPLKIEKNINNCTIIDNMKNEGKGYCLKKGFNYSFDRCYTHALVMDCDSQHPPYMINDFLNQPSNINLIYGKRNFANPMPIKRIISNYLSSKLISLIYNKKILDSQCGFRRYKIKDIIYIYTKENGYQYETEILLNLLNANFKFKHVRIPTIYSNETSNIKAPSDALAFIKLVITLPYHKVKYDKKIK